MDKIIKRFSEIKSENKDLVQELMGKVAKNEQTIYGEVSDWVRDYHSDLSLLEREVLAKMLLGDLVIHHSEMLQPKNPAKVWVVTQESCVNGEINFNVVVCDSEETAKAQMQKEIDWLKNESIHFRDFDKEVEEFEVDQEDCRFFLNDTWDDYYEEIIVMEKEITTL